MKGDRLRIAESVAGGWNTFDPSERELAWSALERIDDDPISGVPLDAPVKGYWSLRAGAIRVVYRLVPESGRVIVLRISRVGEKARA